jgi:hypothetical protein
MTSGSAEAKRWKSVRSWFCCREAQSNTLCYVHLTLVIRSFPVVDEDRSWNGCWRNWAWSNLRHYPAILPGDTEGKHEKISVRMVDVPDKIRIRNSQMQVRIVSTWTNLLGHSKVCGSESQNYYRLFLGITRFLDFVHCPVIEISCF